MDQDKQNNPCPSKEDIERQEDFEDLELGLSILERVRSGAEEVLSSGDVWKGNE